MDRPALGVCIPTYRRPDQLRRCVESILRSAGSRRVPIHIADDSGDDTNLAVVSELRARSPDVVHHRNARNLGIDRNILHAVNVCDSRHAWIMGEDDRMTPEAITTVLDAVQSGDSPFVYVNYSSVNEDVSLVLNERSLDLAGDVDESAEDFFAAHAWSMGFIGACVVAKDLWRTVDPQPYVGTYFAHVGVIVKYLRGRRVHLLARPLVLNRVGSTKAFTWTSSTFEVLHGWASMVDRLRGVYPEEVCDRAALSFWRAHGIGSIPFFCYLRADGALTPGGHDRYVRNGPYAAHQRAASWWIARAPPAIFRAARRVLAVARRRRGRRLSGY